MAQSLFEISSHNSDTKYNDSDIDKKSLSSFKKRLAWHCHFIQKFYDEPTIEYENMNRAYDGMRADADEKKLEAWKKGLTGFPFVDACMRFVTKTGWLNFRMRAMLVSFASYQLWLDWRLTSKHLSKFFTDYEPGIHYSQDPRCNLAQQASILLEFTTLLNSLMIRIHKVSL